MEAVSQVPLLQVERLGLYFLCLVPLCYMRFSSTSQFIVNIFRRASIIFSNVIGMKSVKMTMRTHTILHFLLLLVLAFPNWVLIF